MKINFMDLDIFCAVTCLPMIQRMKKIEPILGARSLIAPRRGLRQERDLYGESCKIAA